MKTFSVKNFERFQHYKDRFPPWIKLYNELLDDYEFGRLPDASKMHLIAIWLLASRSENKIPYDATWVARRINANTKVDLTLLACSGFIVVDQSLPDTEQDASTPLAECLSREREEGETEERREEKKDTPLRSDDWPKDYGDQFWQAFPRKTEKLSSMKKLATIRKSGIVTFADLMAGVKRYAEASKTTEQRYVKHPTTWLNAGCWSDELQTGGGREGTGDPRKTGHAAIFAAGLRAARKIVGDGEVAGTADEGEFPFGHGAVGGGTKVPDEPAGRDRAGDDRCKSGSEGVFEGEIIAPDKPHARVSGGWKHH
jgi:hypothetical protein